MISLIQSSIIILFIQVIVTVHCACNDTITRAQYDSIQLLWPRDQVTATVGSPGNEVFTSMSYVLVRYKGTTKGSKAIIKYVNGGVESKRQYKLC
jgi:hypothetical protein